jgi:hypothetical protein
VPSRLIIPPIFKTQYTNVVSNQASFPETNSVRSFKLHFPEKSQLMLAYYLLLTICIVGTASLIDRTGLARTIMDASRIDIVSPIHILTPKTPPVASIVITSSPELIVLLTTPDNQYLGNTADGILFRQPINGTVEKNSFTNLLILTLKHAPTGTYNLEFSARRAGNFPFTLNQTDQSGIRSTQHTETVTLLGNEHRRYLLDFNSQNVTASNLVFKNAFYRP